MSLSTPQREIQGPFGSLQVAFQTRIQLSHWPNIFINPGLKIIAQPTCIFLWNKWIMILQGMTKAFPRSILFFLQDNLYFSHILNNSHWKEDKLHLYSLILNIRFYF